MYCYNSYKKEHIHRRRLYAKEASIYRGEHYHNTVIFVHNRYSQIRLSFPVAGIKSEYNIGRYKRPDRTIEDYRVITDNGNL